MTDCFVRGAAMWTEEHGAPEAAWLPSRLRRRTSMLTRMAAEVFGRIAERGALDSARIATVHASAYGEIATTLGLLDMMQEDDGAVSPTRFHNSVHNTGAGYLSIATGNRGFSTAVAAGTRTVAAALCEAVALLATQEPEVVLLVAEEPVGAPFAELVRHGPLAVGFHLSREAGPRSMCFRVQRGPVDGTIGEDDGELASNPCLPALWLARAVGAARPARVPLQAQADTDGRTWLVELAEETS